MQNNSEGRYGALDVESQTSHYNAVLFVVTQVLARCNTATLVKVVAADAETVDVQPLVNQLDGQGVAIPHGVIHGVPFLRLQGGTNAIIIDPKKGDLGVAVFADRDISSVKANKSASNPGSMRRFDMADGVYLGGLLNGDPQQYVQFLDDAIKIVSPNKIHLEAPTIELAASDTVSVTAQNFIVNATSTFNGAVTATDTITAPEVIGGGKSLHNHVHKGTKPGLPGELSGPPL